MTATDFRVALNSVPPPAIGGGFGGAPFPMPPRFELPAAGGGFLRVIYAAGQNDPGIPPGGTYTHSFPGWPVGTRFDVTFSYLIDGQEAFLDPGIVITVAESAQGQTTPVPEPTTLLLLGTGVAGVAMKMRKRLKSRRA